MDLFWPGFLYFLGLIPLIVAAYVWILRRRHRFAVRYSSLSLVREAIPRGSWLRRHLPFILFVFALASLIVALARPVTKVIVPAGKTVVILAIDVSRSMCAADIPPNRLEAAKSAAQGFVEKQDTNVLIGVVAFSGFAELVQPPTSDKELLNHAIERLTTGRRTAIGSAILESLDAIAEIDNRVAPSDQDPLSETQNLPLPKGKFVPHIVVLLTDGRANAGVYPLDAAQQAVERGVRVYTIGFGTANGNIPSSCLSPSRFGEQFGNQGFGGGFRRGIDEETLIQIADMTGGAYFPAASSGELVDVFQNLPTDLITKEEVMEVSVIFSAFGAALAALAILFSLIWHPLP